MLPCKAVPWALLRALGWGGQGRVRRVDAGSQVWPACMTTGWLLSVPLSPCMIWASVIP